MIGAFVLAVASTGLAAGISAGHQLSRSPVEGMLALDAMRSERAQILATAFPSVAAAFHLQGFDVPGLRAVDDDPDGLPGEIVFFYGPGGDTRYYEVLIRVRWQGSHGVQVRESRFSLANLRADTGVPVSLESLEAVQ